jgi:hypothetical protein
MEGAMHLGYRHRKTGGGSWTARRFLGTFKFFERSLIFTGISAWQLRLVRAADVAP